MEYSFDEIMERFDITWSDGCDGDRVIESGCHRDETATVNTVAKLGAAIMRLEDEVKKLKKGKLK